MEIRFSQSARKHRIGKARVLYVIHTCEALEFQAEGPDPDRCKWIGVDDRGLELEVVAVRTKSELLIIHVMPTALRKGSK
ncbi:MAG: hypothetical protein NTX12_08200 [Actinobacteria bacterium]|nr:hypothetical protein [Actinomycetota bacterium]